MCNIFSTSQNSYLKLKSFILGSTNNASTKLDEETLINQLRQQRLGDGHSGSDSKHSDTMSDQGNIPYDILLQDLTQAKRQLFDLRNLVRFSKIRFSYC